MSEFPLHSAETAPEAARDTLAAVEADFGMLPNLERTMATAPALLKTYAFGWEVFAETSLSPIAQQVVYQTVNFENECTYCVPWHTLLCRHAGMAEADVHALRAGAALSDPKLEALRRFTQAVVRCQGKIAQADRDAFLAAGWSAQTALEVVLGIAIKVMSNYTNAMAGTPHDAAVAELAWTKPVIKPAP
ncbi:MAG: carboxymuconolactone decarboxylase family protein [Pseudomonadota bacterium]